MFAAAHGGSLIMKEGSSMLRNSAIFFIASLTLLSGCSQPIASYTSDPQSTNLLRGGNARIKLVLKPAAFSDDGSIMCRLVGRISLPDGQSFGQYLMEALHQDLKSSELMDQAIGKELTLHLKRVDFSSALGATNWFLDVEYESMNEKFMLSTVYNDRSSYVGAKACGNIALYFRNCRCPALASALHASDFSEGDRRACRGGRCLVW